MATFNRVNPSKSSYGRAAMAAFNRARMSPVKFTTFLFSEKFNGAGRNQEPRLKNLPYPLLA
jgi:hypothetical protein